MASELVVVLVHHYNAQPLIQAAGLHLMQLSYQKYGKTDN